MDPNVHRHRPALPVSSSCQSNSQLSLFYLKVRKNCTKERRLARLRTCALPHHTGTRCRFLTLDVVGLRQQTTLISLAKTYGGVLTDVLRRQRTLISRAAEVVEEYVDAFHFSSCFLKPDNLALLPLGGDTVEPARLPRYLFFSFVFYTNSNSSLYSDECVL
uniref:Uncharacterized protein n=1 Tax=Rhipicephalus zambeziensis TaxID=60191 RepID=A0A224YJV3_9ACAR